MFKSSYNKGFAMTFKNGLTISVQWGVGNYCERRSFHSTVNNDMKNIFNESVNAEIAIWSNDGTDFNFENDWVKGYVSADEVAGWITMVSTAKDMNDLNTIVSETKTKAFVMQFNPDNY
jgi:hypothetical protein